jgi:hypothetical protein
MEGPPWLCHASLTDPGAARWSASIWRHQRGFRCHRRGPSAPPVPLVGDGMQVPCVHGTERPYLSLDAAASTDALSQVLAAVEAFVPRYSSVHRGAGYKSQLATAAYEDARAAALSFACPGRRPAVTTWRSSAAIPPKPSITWPIDSGWAGETSTSPR